MSLISYLRCFSKRLLARCLTFACKEPSIHHVILQLPTKAELKEIFQKRLSLCNKILFNLCEQSLQHSKHFPGLKIESK